MYKVSIFKSYGLIDWYIGIGGMEVMEQRRSEIVSFVNENKEVTFAQLKERFCNVSEMTLRTDLKVLDKEQKIVRIHGGAKSLETVAPNDDFLRKRYVRNTEEKKLIAKKSLALCQSNQTIFIDSGSTTTMLAHNIEDKPNYFVTSGLTCAIELAKLKNVKVSLTGGNMNHRSLSVNGLEGVRFIEKVNFDVAFIGVTNFSHKTGFTCESLEDAELKRVALKKANKVIILMDSSKYEKKGTYTICDLNEVTAIVSDEKLPQEFIKECESAGIVVY